MLYGVVIQLYTNRQLYITALGTFVFSTCIPPYNRYLYSGLKSPNSAFCASERFRSVGILSRFLFSLMQDMP